jgi:hypothetical protein
MKNSLFQNKDYDFSVSSLFADNTTSSFSQRSKSSCLRKTSTTFLLTSIAQKNKFPQVCLSSKCNSDKLSTRELLLYLFYVKHIPGEKILKLIKKMERQVEKINDDITIRKFKSPLYKVKLLIGMIPSQLPIPRKLLFPEFTEELITTVEAIGELELNKINIVFSSLQTIVKKWNTRAQLKPFGSLVNGLMLRNGSDLDLTILFPEKLNKHPMEYCGGFLTLLEEETEVIWQVVKTKNLFLVTTDYYYGFSIDILFNNITGLANSEYVRTLASVDFRFHKLGLFVKKFVNEQKIFERLNKLNSFSII